MTRGTIIWFVGSAIVGAAAGGLHLLRSELGGAHTGVPLAVGAFGLTALAAAMLFHGVVLAAREQDAAAGPVASDDAWASDTASGEGYRPGAAGVPGTAGVPATAGEREGPEAPEPPAVYTFRAGKPVTDRPARPAKRDRPSRG